MSGTRSGDHHPADWIAGLGVDVAPYNPDENYEAVNAKFFGFTRDELTEWKGQLSP